MSVAGSIAPADSSPARGAANPQGLDGLTAESTLAELLDHSLSVEGDAPDATADVDGLRLDSAERLASAAQRVLMRAADRVLDPVVVAFSDGRRQLVDARAILLGLAHVAESTNVQNRSLRANPQARADRLDGKSSEIHEIRRDRFQENRDREPTEQALRNHRHRLLRQTMALHDIARIDSVRRSDFDQALRDIACIIAFTLHVDRVAVWTVTETPDGLQTTPVASYGLKAWDAEDFALSRFPLYREALIGERSLVADVAEDEPCVAELLEPVLRPAGVMSLVHLCVKVEERPVALLRCEHRRATRSWADDEVNFIEAAANFAALAAIGQERNRAVQALHDSEARLLQVLATSPVGVCIVDREGWIRFANSSFCALFQRTEETTLATNINTLYADPDQHRHCLETFDAQGALRGLEIAFRRSGGLPEENGTAGSHLDSERPLWTVMSWERTRFEDRPAVVVWLFDITDIKEAESRLRQAKDQAEAATRAKSDFLATMSHEIRTPLNGVLGMLDILGRSRLDADQERAVTVIRESSLSLMRIIGDILDFSKIEAGKLDLDPVPMRLRDMVEGVAATLAPIAHNKGLSLTGTVDPAIPTWLVADPVRVRQILLNLTNNAIKFTNDGRVTVEAIGLGTVDGRATLRIRVSDTGIGLTREQADRLFQPFVQAENSTTRRFGGTGLGLSICHRLTQRMGGRIGVDSNPGEGSTFWVELTLPVADEPVGEDGLTGAAPVAAWPEWGGALPKLAPDGPILVADDHPVNREVILRQLEQLGCAADAVNDGRAALEALEQRRYILLLTDWNMPEMDGLQLTRAIRAREADGSGWPSDRLPIVGITANAFSGEIERCMAGGMDDCLTKPVNTAKLGHCLARWIPVAAPAQAPVEVAASPALPNAPLPKEGSPIDTGRFRDVLGDDRDAIRGLLNRYLESSQPIRDRLGEAIADRRSAEAVRGHAHSLKGASGMVGASALAKTCLALEQAAIADNWTEIDAASPSLAQEWDNVCQFIRTY